MLVHLVEQLYIVAKHKSKTKDYLRVDDHDLAFLTVWPGCTVQEHRIGVGNDEVECTNLLLPILERNMSRMNSYYCVNCVLQRTG